MKTSNRWLLSCFIASLTLAGGATAAHADEPVAGAELSIAIPLKATASNTADLGGAFGIYVGYQLGLAENLRLALLANPEIAFFKSAAIAQGANLVRRELGLPETRVPAADARLQTDIVPKAARA